MKNEKNQKKAIDFMKKACYTMVTVKNTTAKRLLKMTNKKRVKEVKSYEKS